MCIRDSPRVEPLHSILMVAALVLCAALLISYPVSYTHLYEKQAEVEKQQLLADARKQADAIVAAGKASAEAERQSKLREADAQTTALALSLIHI